MIVFIIGFQCYWQGRADHANTLAVRKGNQAKSVLIVQIVCMSPGIFFVCDYLDYVFSSFLDEFLLEIMEMEGKGEK